MKTINEWVEECDYIHTVAMNKDFYDFNNDRECFDRYVIMQARAAFKGTSQQHGSVAQYMLKALLKGLEP